MLFLVPLKRQNLSICFTGMVDQASFLNSDRKVRKFKLGRARTIHRTDAHVNDQRRAYDQIW